MHRRPPSVRSAGSETLTLPDCARLAAVLILGGWLVGTGARLSAAESELRVGVAETDITPPLGFPMAGYYHERLATGAKDPLKAKAVVFRSGDVQAAWVACDLTGIAVDLSTAVRRRAAEKTGIPAAHIVLSASHSHTAPDYSQALFDHLGGSAATETARERAAYAGRLIDAIAAAIVQAHAAAAPATLAAGSATQETPVSFCRRFVMRDGSVRTWVGLKHPDAVRSAGPIDPEIGLVSLRRVEGDQPLGLLSNFALHLDTVGGLEWSGDYPYFIEQAVRKALGAQVVSLFGTGCCGDINHADPTGKPRNPTNVIGGALGETICGQLSNLQRVAQPTLQARSATVRLPLEEVSQADVRRSVQVVAAAMKGEKVDFFDHVRAYKQLLLDNLRHREPVPEAAPYLSWGLTHTWRGIGDALPVEVHVFTLGSDVALVFLPGEVFVELGQAIKRASPFRTTLVVELSQCVETIYIPNRGAYAAGGYEVANSAVQPGSGEMLVEAAVRLLRESATALPPQTAQK